MHFISKKFIHPPPTSHIRTWSGELAARAQKFTLILIFFIAWMRICEFSNQFLLNKVASRNSGLINSWFSHNSGLSKQLSILACISLLTVDSYVIVDKPCRRTTPLLRETIVTKNWKWKDPYDFWFFVRTRLKRLAALIAGQGNSEKILRNPLLRNNSQNQKSKKA